MPRFCWIHGGGAPITATNQQPIGEVWLADKRPALLFYPGDWLKDTALRSVSVEARGLWIDMLCLMHESARRGYLQHATGKPVTQEQLARMTGCSSEQASRLLQELIDSGVCSCTEHGSIYNRRMVRDEQKRAKCSEAGKKGVTLKGHRQGQYKGPPQGVPETENETSLPVQSVVSEKELRKKQIEERISVLAVAMDDRHPPRRNKIGPVTIRKKLGEIVRHNRDRDPLELLDQIERNHASWCNHDDWNRNGHEFCKELANWLAPTEGRYLKPAPPPPAPSLFPMGDRASKTQETMAAVELRKQIGWRT